MTMKAVRCTRNSAARFSAAAEDGARAVRHFCAPNRPAGRTSSTIAMMMKMTVLDASG